MRARRRWCLHDGYQFLPHAIGVGMLKDRRWFTVVQHPLRRLWRRRQIYNLLPRGVVVIPEQKSFSNFFEIIYFEWWTLKPHLSSTPLSRDSGFSVELATNKLKKFCDDSEYNLRQCPSDCFSGTDCTVFSLIRTLLIRHSVLSTSPWVARKKTAKSFMLF